MTALPSNETLLAFSTAVPWREIERQKRLFNQALAARAADHPTDDLPLAELSALLGVPVTLYTPDDTDGGNVVLAQPNGQRYVLGSAISNRYRSGEPFVPSIAPYNLNPSVNHTNIHETEDPATKLRVLGAEIELGIVHQDGGSPSEAATSQASA